MAVVETRTRFSAMAAAMLLSLIAGHARAQTFRISRPAADRFPLNGAYLYAETNFGYPHRGVDMLMDEGDSVLSAVDGRVYETGFQPNGAGKYVMTQSVWEGKDLYLIYMHLSQNDLVAAGDSVRVGQLIGLSGNTGNSTGPHLHFEIRLNRALSGLHGNRRNPELWMAMEGMGAIYGRVPDAPEGTRVDITPDPKPRPPYVNYGWTFTYTFDGAIGSDDVYGENYAVGDVKPGVYTITALDGQYRRTVTVEASKVVNADDGTASLRPGGPQAAPDRFRLLGSAPNPFTATTALHFQATGPGDARVRIIDTLGKQVRKLNAEIGGSATGFVLWDGRNEQGRLLPGGVYFYAVTWRGQQATGRLVLLR